MIKILFFIETIEGGGAEKVLRNLVNNMDQTRFDITVQTVWPCDPTKYFVTGIHYKSMYPVQNKINTLRYRLEAATGLAYALHLKDDYDIECAYLEYGSTKILASSTNQKATKIAWVHCDFKTVGQNPVAIAEKTAKYYKKYDKVVCVSEIGKQSFLELFGDEHATYVVHNTVDCEEIFNKKAEVIEEIDQMKRPLVVSLGRLSPQKNYMRLLSAHNRLIKEGIEHTLLILGEGPERSMLEEYIKEHQLQKTVHMPGFKSNPYTYLDAADLLACSSVHESFSTFITEGLVLGKPIVTTEVCGMKELLGESEHGLITDNEDEAFYQGMKQMLTDTELRKHYIEKSNVRGKDFTTQKLVKETEEFLINCANSKG